MRGNTQTLLTADEHATALFAYFVDFDDFRFSRDLRQHYTTRTML